MAQHKYIQKLFAVIEFVIIFLIIAFLVATTLPGLLRVRKRSQAVKGVPLPQSSNRLALDERAIESPGHSFGPLVLPA